MKMISIEEMEKTENVIIRNDYDYLKPFTELIMLAGEISNWSINNISKFNIQVLNEKNIHIFEGTWHFVFKQVTEISNLLATLRKSKISNIVLMSIIDSALSIKKQIEIWIQNFFGINLVVDHANNPDMDFVKKLIELRNAYKHPVTLKSRDAFSSLYSLTIMWNEIHVFKNDIIVISPLITQEYKAITKNGTNTNEVKYFYHENLLASSLKMVEIFVHDAKNIINDFVKKAI